LSFFCQNKFNNTDSSHNRYNRYFIINEFIEEGESITQEDIEKVDAEIIEELEDLYNDEENEKEEGR
jgi:hypothetical protein